MSLAPNDGWSDSSPDEAERLRAVTTALEEIVRDRSLLGSLTVEERTRLLRAAAGVHEPDLVQRRRWAKALRRMQELVESGASAPRTEVAGGDRLPTAA